MMSMSPFCAVDAPWNRPDRNGVGCVPYEYEIARCAISNEEWCEFLNAVDGNGRKEQKHLAEERQKAWLRDVEFEGFCQALDALIAEKRAAGIYRFRTESELEHAKRGACFFYANFSRKTIELSDGRCVYFSPDARSMNRNGGDRVRCWAEYAFHAVSSSGEAVPGCPYRERWFNQEKTDAIPGIEAIIKNEVCGAMLSDKQREKDAVLFLGSLANGKRIEIVTRVDYSNAELHNLAEVTVLLKNARKKSPPLKPLSEVVEAVERHQGAGYLPSTVESLPNCGLTCKGVTSLGLWHKDMGTGVLGGIDEDFTVKPGWEKKPVVYVDYVSVCRYCNWLMTGDTEKGAYDLSVTPPRRLKGATYFLPTDDEWYKAAYYDCSIVRLFGLFDWKRGKYWKYPTRSDEIPTQDQANFERGDCLSPLALTPQSNNQTTKQSNNSYYYLADVDAYADSPSPCGALQMGGNAWEFLEDVKKVRGEGEQWRLVNTLRGGSFGYTETGLDKSNRDETPYGSRCYVFGARIARKLDGWQPRSVPLWFRVELLARKVMRRLARWCRP